MRYLTIILLFISSLAMAQRPYLFPTISDAASNTYIGIGAYVQTQGYNASGDGGGALYRMTAIASAPFAADSGYVYPVTAAKVLVQVLEDEYLRSATYGVVCGDSGEATNNYNRLQRYFTAINALDKQAFINGCNDTIYVDFTSALTTTLTSHDKFVMRGEGADVTRIKATAGSIDFGFSDAAKVNLFDLYLDGYDATAFGGIGGADQSLTYANDTLTISGGNYVVIAGGSGGTDDQTLTLDSVAGTYNLSIESGNTVKIKRDTDTDDQTLSFSSPNLSISEGNTVDLSALQDGTGTDDQVLTIDSTATSYTATLEDGGNIKWAKVTNTDDQAISVDSNATTYTITLEDGGNVKLLKSVNTDAQTLSFSDPNLSISGGNSVDLTALKDGTGTDDQTISIDSNATTYTLSIESGNSVNFAKGGGGGTPGGDNNDLQINRSGSFAGSDSLQWVGASGYLDVKGRIDQTYGGTSTALGYQALDADDGTSNNNVAVGYQSLTTATSALNNVAVGMRAGQSALGNNNVYVGHTAGDQSTGSGNTAIGAQALGSLGIASSGSNNSSVGSFSLQFNTTGANNSALGGASLRYNSTGKNNVTIGYQAGHYVGSGTSNFLNQINNSIYIGYRSRAGADSISNETVIGYDLVGNGANTVTIGNSSVTDSYMGGTMHSAGSYIGKVTTFNAATGQTSYGDYICMVDYTTVGTTTLTIDTDNLVSGYTMIIKDMDGNAGSNTITIDTEGAETIDGAASITITTNYGAVRLFSDGTNWYTY